MTEFIIFLIGLLLGGLIGVVMMCCLQINRLYNNHSKRNLPIKVKSKFRAK